MKPITLALLLSFVVLPVYAAKKYTYFRVGNQRDVITQTTRGTVLMGAHSWVTATRTSCRRRPADPKYASPARR